MGAVKKEKNTVSDTTIKTEGDVTIGDRQTINVFGTKADSSDIEFAIKVFVILMAVFGVTCLVFMAWTPRKTPADVAAGAFFVLLLIFIVVLIRVKRHPSINIKK
jgi:hypothetical protein